MGEERPDHPGKYLRTMLERKGWTRDDLAAVTGYSTKALSGVAAGKVGVTPAMATALSAAFGNDAADWLRWDADYQLALVDADRSAIERRAQLYNVAPIREMQRRGWIAGIDDPEALERELERFFGGSLSEGVQFPVAPRKTATLDDLNIAERAWCFRARQVAMALPVVAFDPNLLERLEVRLRRLAAFANEVHRLPTVLAEFGIRFVVVEPLPSARIDGATFWIDGSPVIALSVRFDRIDAFWFTVYHEYVHIKRRHAYSADANLVSENEQGVIGITTPSADEEDAVNREATSMLIPADEIDGFVRRLSPLYSSVRLIQFAHRVKMHPGIIVGQLQHRGELGYSAHREFLVKVRNAITGTALTDGWGQSIGHNVL